MERLNQKLKSNSLTITAWANTTKSKKNDGFAIWCDFIKHSVTLLREGGYLCIIVPSLWLKPDKAGMYNYLLNYKIEKIKLYTNTETNQIFKGQAQTPTTLFLLKKEPRIHNIIPLYCKIRNEYVPYSLKRDYPIPMANIDLINHLMHLIMFLHC